MKRYAIGIIILLTGLVLSLFIVPAFAQEEKYPAKPPEAAVSPMSENEPAQAPETATEPQAGPVSKEKELAIYGEVQSVNAQLNSMTIQYYDYDSDEEKTVDLLVGKDTKLENANSINDVKQGDWVDVTYALSGEKNIAKTIAVEKEEEEKPPVTATEETPQTETAPEEPKPVDTFEE